MGLCAEYDLETAIVGDLEIVTFNVAAATRRFGTAIISGIGAYPQVKDRISIAPEPVFVLPAQTRVLIVGIRIVGAYLGVFPAELIQPRYQWVVVLDKFLQCETGQTAEVTIAFCPVERIVGSALVENNATCGFEAITKHVPGTAIHDFVD